MHLPSLPLGKLAAALLALSLLPARGADLDTVSAILVEGSLDQNWPDRAVVAFHRQNSTGPLTVKFTIAGTAVFGVHYTVPPGSTVTIPDGDREAWLEFAPTGQALDKAKFIVVTLQPDAAYQVSLRKAEQSALITLAKSSPGPCPKAAVRFLQQAAFGPSADFKNVQAVVSKGYDKWITEQFARPVGLQQPYLEALKRARKGQLYSDAKVLSWWREAMSASASADPLRQRVAFAFSEIMVISDRLDELGNQPLGMMNYYDMLLRGSFGNFRTLLFNVAMHPCMGVYLNHLGNEKGDPDAGTFADENFAREIMQLFSIGLWELNPDGTPRLDANRQPIPTYDNAVIADMAKVMTGFGFSGKKADNFHWSPDNFTAPMRIWDEYHDVTPKTLLNGVTLPARVASDPDTGAAGLADVNAAIDMLFQHPNCPPFISKQLIQKLVTSNPTPAYVGRVAAKFIDNGSGVRGDLKAVLRAILLDAEARDPRVSSLATSGKMKEPYLRTINLARAFHARAANGIFGVSYLGEIHFQEPLSSPSVFNFFKPGYSPAGPVSDAGLLGPEFQILNAVTATAVPNYYHQALRIGFTRWGGSARELVKPNFTTELKLVKDVPALLRRLDLLLTGGTLPNEQHQVIREAVEAVTEDMWEWKLERVRMAVYLISTSPEFGILR